jgi:hypothetical protein
MDLFDHAYSNSDVAEEIDDELEEWLRGVTLRIVHRRTSGRSGDINNEKRRLKKFQNFGATLMEQRFWKRNVPPGDTELTVYDYFTHGESLCILLHIRLLIVLKARIFRTSQNREIRQRRQATQA